ATARRANRSPTCCGRISSASENSACALRAFGSSLRAATHGAPRRASQPPSVHLAPRLRFRASTPLSVFDSARVVNRENRCRGTAPFDPSADGLRLVGIVEPRHAPTGDERDTTPKG